MTQFMGPIGMKMQPGSLNPGLNPMTNPLMPMNTGGLGAIEPGYMYNTPSEPPPGGPVNQTNPLNPAHAGGAMMASPANMLNNPNNPNNPVANNGVGWNVNPYANLAFESAAKAVGNQYINRGLPALSSQFRNTGNYGSSAHALATGQLGQEYLGSLNDLAAQIYTPAFENQQNRMFHGQEGHLDRTYSLYNQQQQRQADAYNQHFNREYNLFDNQQSRQQQALQFLSNQGLSTLLATPNAYGTLSDISGRNIDRGIGVGNQLQAYHQAIRDADVDRFNWNRDDPYNQINWFSSILSGQPYRPQYAEPSNNFWDNLIEAGRIGSDTYDQWRRRRG